MMMMMMMMNMIAVVLIIIIIITITRLMQNIPIISEEDISSSMINNDTL